MLFEKAGKIVFTAELQFQSHLPGGDIRTAQKSGGSINEHPVKEPFGRNAGIGGELSCEHVAPHVHEFRQFFHGNKGCSGWRCSR